MPKSIHTLTRFVGFALGVAIGAVPVLTLAASATNFSNVRSGASTQVPFENGFCLRQSERQIRLRFESRDRHYRLWSQAGIRPGNEMRWLPGNNGEAVVLTHGFAASPFEVSALGQKINAAGFTVYMPLLYGFGGNTRMANLASWPWIMDEYKSDVALVAKCHRRTHLIGFSMGGTVSADFILNNPDLDGDGIFENSRIASLTLISPYFDFHLRVTGWAAGIAGWQNSSVSVAWLYNLTGHPDLAILFTYSDYYSVDLPLQMLQQIVGYPNQLSQRVQHGRPSDIPLHLILNENDQTISIHTARFFGEKLFSKYRETIYTQDRGLPHQMILPAANPDFEDFANQVIHGIQTAP